jgi:hypothetical protein
MWNGSVLLGGNGEVRGWSDPFASGLLIGYVKPIGGTNVGAGIFEARPYPTATLTTGTGITYNATSKRFSLAAGVVIEDKVIPGFLSGAIGSKAINCVLAGPPAEYTGGYTAMVEGPATIGQMELEWCTIAPTVASAYYDGIGRGVKASYCDVKGVIDGTRGFSTSVNGVRIQCYATHFHSSPQFRPDYAYSGTRGETHNDVVVQCQGNPNGDDNDLLFDGCNGDARHSTTQGTTPATRDQISAIMITPSASVGAVHMTYKNGWLSGGLYCVNGGSDGVDDYGPSSLVLTGNRMERPGTDVYGDGRAPDVAIALDTHLIYTVSGNVYEDNGAPVPVTNA